MRLETPGVRAAALSNASTKMADLYSTFAPGAARLAYLIGDEHLAEDLVQESPDDESDFQVEGRTLTFTSGAESTTCSESLCGSGRSSGPMVGRFEESSARTSARMSGPCSVGPALTAMKVTSEQRLGDAEHGRRVELLGQRKWS